MSGVFENNDLKDYSLKSDYQIELSGSSQIQFGAFATLYDIKYSYAQSDTVDILNRSGKAFCQASLYLQNKTKFINDRLQIFPGISVDHFGTTNSFYLEPRASVTYNLTDRLILKGATGKYYQFANRVTREDIMSGNKEFWIISDGKSVPISSSVHLVAGISYESDNFTFSAEGYLKKIRNLTEYSLRIKCQSVGSQL